MNINITKKIIQRLKKEGLGLNLYILLLSIVNKEEIYEENEKNPYLWAQELVLKGLLIENFGDEEQLFDVTERGELLVYEIEQL